MSDVWSPVTTWLFYLLYSKTCVKQPLSKRPQTGFQDQLPLNAGQKYCRMLQGEHSASILQYFRPSLSYHLSLRSWFCLLFSGRFTKVLLYMFMSQKLHWMMLASCFSWPIYVWGDPKQHVNFTKPIIRMKYQGYGKWKHQCNQTSPSSFTV